MLRSILLHRTPHVFRPGELTALAALAGTLCYAGLALGLHINADAAGLFAIVLAAALNFISRRYQLQTRAAWSPRTRQRRRE